MITLAAAFFLLQQATAPPAALVVRQGDRAESIPIVATGRGPMVRVPQLLAPLGAVLRQDAADRYRLVIGGNEIELTVGLRVARVNGAAHPLASSPALVDGALFVPLSLLTDVVPRAATGFMYDVAAGELRRFAASAARRDSAPPAPAPAAPRPAAGAARPPTPPARAPRRMVVVVDAGHGGRDRGMRGPIGSTRKIYEADVTLAVSRRLRDVLTARGVEVVMTRTTDTLIALADRGRIANRARADIFVSIHVNAANPRWRRPGDARGFETYFLAEAKTEDEQRVAELENEAVKYEVEEDSRAGDPLSFILNDMKQNEYLRESSELAEMVQRGMRRVHPAPSRGVKQAGFRVLVGAFMPAILVEIGFGTNRADAAWISSAAGEAALAESIADSLTAYLTGYVERRAAGAPGVR